VDLPAGLRLAIEVHPSAADCDRVALNLDRYNREFLGETRFSQIGLFIRDETRELRAGLVGSAYAGWLYISDLWVAAGLRRRGIGRQLLALAEARAMALECHSARLDTFSFQAPDFYCKFGWEVLATLDQPPDHCRLLLKKSLKPAGR
jgi:ribosomal protein S18 acetylase RimI-like enzyme